jgi:large subunit ribosomal protein L6
MSRIGKQPIPLENGVDVQVSKGNLVSVKGPKGQLYVQIDPDLAVKVEDGGMTVERPPSSSATVRCTGSTARSWPTPWKG